MGADCDLSMIVVSPYIDMTREDANISHDFSEFTNEVIGDIVCDKIDMNVNYSRQPHRDYAS